MKQKYGKVVWTDITDVEKSYIRDGTENFLEGMGAECAEQDITQITDVFMCAGSMRGRIFYNGYFKPFDKGNGSLRLSVYGVKGEHREKSISHYTHWYVSQEEELLGENFFRAIFGSYFGSEAEYRMLQEPEKIFREQQDFPLLKTDHTQGDLFIHIMAKLWEILEDDPCARFIIVLPQNQNRPEEAEKKAEEESVKILQQIYLMLPQKLRLMLGFATCVTPKEMMELAETKDLPIHLFITGQDVDTALFSKAKFPYHIFRIDEEEQYVYNEQKQNALKKLLGYDADGLLEELLDTSEEEQLRMEQILTGFEGYEKILEPITVPWYEADKDMELLKLLEHRELQEAILGCGELERIRRIKFLGEVLPEKNYCEQLAICLLYAKENKDVIVKVREKLGLGFLIDAMEKMHSRLDRISNIKIGKLQEEKDKIQKEKDKIQKEKEEQAEKQKKEAERQKERIEGYDAKIRKKDEQAEAARQTLREREGQIAILNGDIQEKDKKISKLAKENQERENSIAKLREEKEKEISKRDVQILTLKKQINDLISDKQYLLEKISSLEQDNENLKEEIVRKDEKEELIAHCFKRIADLEDSYARQNDEICNLNSAMAGLEDETETLEDATRRLEGETRRLEGETKRLREEVKKLKEKKGIAKYIEKILGKSF